MCLFVLLSLTCEPRLIIEKKIEKFLIHLYKENHINHNIWDVFKNDWRHQSFTPDQKEIINSTIEFFYFIQNKENFIELDKIYNTVKKNEENFSLHFNTDKNFYLTLIVFKSFLHYSPIYTSFFGEYKNSDKLLDFCVEMYISYCIFNDIDFVSKRHVRNVFYKLFHTLVKANVIEEKKIKINKFLSKFWCLNVKYKSECDYQNFKISYTPFSIKKKKNETYLVGKFFWNVYDIYSKNFYSDTKFNITKEEYLDLLLKRYLHIDVDYFKWIKKICEDDFLENINLEELNKELIIKLNADNWDITTKKNIETIQKKYSKKIEYIVLKNFLNTYFDEKDKIYIPFYFDFRGRKYYNSLVGPTQNKILRFVYFYGWYDYSDFSTLIKIERISYFKNQIKSFCEKNNYVYHEIFLESYFWLLIGIGKFKIDKTTIKTKDENIIRYGIDLVTDKIFDAYDKTDKIEILHYIKIMESLRFENLHNLKKRIISKDGTASVYQISMILLQPLDQKALEYVNLYDENNSWVDTYSFIIKEFKLKHKLDSSFFEILTRKTCKKTIMTIPYSIGLDSAFDYFISTLEENQISYKHIKNLKKKFSLFYKFVKFDFEKTYLYQTSTKEYTDQIMNNFLNYRSIWIQAETGETDLKYNKMEKKTMDFTIEMKINEEIIRERITKLFKIPSKAIDYRQTNVSLGANLRHFYEADLLRITEIYLGYSINSIHDAELIDFNSCSKLMLIKNRIFRESLKNHTIRSIFILI